MSFDDACSRDIGEDSLWEEKKSSNLELAYSYLREKGTSTCAQIAKGIYKHQGAVHNALKVLKWRKLVVQNDDKTWTIVKE